VTAQSYVRLTASTRIYCCTYEDAAPILTIQDGAADITITNPGRGEVTGEDVRFGRLLAEAVTRYAAELETHAAANHAATAADGHLRDLGLRVLPGRRLPSWSRSPRTGGRPARSIFLRTWPSSLAMKTPPMPVKPVWS
jgi:hypothetical protein